MRVQDRLDLSGIGVESADQKHFLESAGDLQIAVAIEAAEIAGSEPAVESDRRLRPLWQVVIALPDAGARIGVVQPDLSHFSRGQFVPRVRVGHANLSARERQADRRRGLLDGVRSESGGREPGALAQTVTVDDVVEAHPLLHGPDGLGWARGSADDRRAKRAQVEILELGVTEHHDVHGRRAGEPGHPFRLDGLQGVTRLERLAPDNGVARQDAQLRDVGAAEVGS